MNINDIQGTKSKPLYRGVAKDILNSRDIEGTAPRFEKVIRLMYIDLVETETIWSPWLLGRDQQTDAHGLQPSYAIYAHSRWHRLREHP